MYLALDANLELIFVLNTIDLSGAEPDRAVREIEKVVGLEWNNVVLASVKSSIGLDEILASIMDCVPPRHENSSSNLRALIFDFYHDSYRAKIVYFRGVDGAIRKGDAIIHSHWKRVNR